MDGETILRPDLTDAGFGTAATALLRRQAVENPVYGRYLATFSGFDPARASWEEFPALPVEAFRHEPVACFDPAQADVVFETSGTTDAARGRHYLRSTAWYCQALRQGFLQALPDLSGHAWISLIPTFEARPVSSLSFMLSDLAAFLEVKLESFCSAAFEIDHVGLRKRIDACVREGKQVALFGTSFAHVEAAGSGGPVKLPQGSVLFDTGGYKGRTQELSKEGFLELLTGVWGLPASRMWNEYGMTELSSQCYARMDEGIHRAPPWLKVRIVDPLSGRLCGPDETGLVQFVDLANVESVAAVATMDLGRYVKDGFELLGRAPAAVARGCSLPYAGGAT